jgi:hypothetical protein
MSNSSAFVVDPLDLGVLEQFIEKRAVVDHRLA